MSEYPATVAALHPELVAAAEAASEITATAPRWSAPDAEWAAWDAVAAPLRKARDNAEGLARPHLCSRCKGRGVTQWKHRLDGVCFSCKGDGLSALGRKVARSA